VGFHMWPCYLSIRMYIILIIACYMRCPEIVTGVTYAPHVM
jgi:hypothetical protein